MAKTKIKKEKVLPTIRDKETVSRETEPITVSSDNIVEVIESVKEKLEQKESFEYKVKMSFNDEVYEFETNDLYTSILERKPYFLKTKITFTIEKDGKKCERLLFVRGGKMIFRNNLSLRIFIRTLIFK